MTTAMMGQLGSGSFNGFTWGSTTKTTIHDAPDIDALAPMRSFDVLKGGASGEWPGRDLLSGKDITLTFRVKGNAALLGDVAQFNDAIAELGRLDAGFIRTDSELPMYLFNSTRIFYCRVRKRSAPIESKIGLQSYFLVACLFHGTDPRMYDANAQTLSTAFPAAAQVGRKYLKHYPETYGASPTAPPMTFTNVGNAPTDWILTIYGPCTNPILQNQTTGEVMQFNLTLSASDTLVVDSKNHSVTLDGTTSRYATIDSSSSWWQLAPGATTIRFSAYQFDAPARAVIVARSAWE